MLGLRRKARRLLTSRERYRAFSHATAARPTLTRLLIIATAAHLLRWAPARLDLYAGFGYPLLSAIKRRPA